MKSENILIICAAALLLLLIAKMATEEVHHPLDDQSQWICFNGECYDGHGGHKKM